MMPELQQSAPQQGSQGPRGFRSRGYRLAAMAALAYSLVVIYASLQPFSGWRAAAAPWGGFLLAPWPRWITLEDLTFNFAAYLPLGFLLALALCTRKPPRSAVLMAASACVVLSFALESAQQHLPARFASAVDLLVNGCGGLTGALIAPLFAPGRRWGERIARERNRWFAEGRQGDAVLLLAGSWLLTQLHPSAVALGGGDLRASFSLVQWFAYAPDSYRLAEAGVAFSAITATGLLLAGAMRRGEPSFWMALYGMFALAFLLKTLGVWLIPGLPQPWHWITPGLAWGSAVAFVTLRFTARLPPRICAALAAVLLLVAVALVNGMPENPYRNIPQHLLSGRAGHFLSFTSMLRALAELWPYLALIHLFASLPGRPHPSR